MYNNLLIGNRIICRRTELNMTLRELAAKVGLSASTVLRYEKGTIGRIKLPVLASIADALDVNVDYLLGITDDPNAGSKIQTSAADFSNLDFLVDALSRLSNEQLLDVINRATARRIENNAERS